MDPADSFEWPLLKREARRFLEKSACPQSCESPLKIPRHLIKVLAIREQIANGVMKIITLISVSSKVIHISRLEIQR